MLTTCRNSFRQQKLFEPPENDGPTDFEIPWASPEESGKTISKYSIMRSWGFTYTQIIGLVSDMAKHDRHTNPLKVTTARIWLGPDLHQTWKELTTCIKIGLQELGCKFKNNIAINSLSFLPGNERNGGPKLNAVGLDLYKYCGKYNNSLPRFKRSPGELWPSIEVASLILLNLPIFMAMDGINIPFISAPGLVISKTFKNDLFDNEDGSMPCFHYKDKIASVIADSCECDDRNWMVTSIADYIEY
jgi:hypothetical protein